MFLLCILSLTFFLVGCNKITNLQVKIDDNIKNTHISKNLPISKLYTGAIAIVTEENIKEPIYQTGDQLLYINEVLGFQILLGEERKGVKIWQTDKTTSKDVKYEVVFSLPDTRYSDNFIKDDSYFNTISIWIIDKNNNDSDSFFDMGINKDSEKVINNNNFIYYIFFTYDQEEMLYLFPTSKCSEDELICPYLIDIIFCDGLKIFDI